MTSLRIHQSRKNRWDYPSRRVGYWERGKIQPLEKDGLVFRAIALTRTAAFALARRARLRVSALTGFNRLSRRRLR